LQKVLEGKRFDDGWGRLVEQAPPGTFTPMVRFAECPIQSSLAVLGKKWTMLILRDIGMRRIDRFNRLLESVKGVTPRVLSMRLNELEGSQYIERIEESRSPRIVRWALTKKGKDALPILVELIAFGSKWHASQTFEDRKPRELEEIFSPKALEIFEKLR
jgi:DNA-binding HxlR family transcriptional regulator